MENNNIRTAFKKEQFDTQALKIREMAEKYGKKINCPLVESEIDDEICFDIHMNVEGLAPDWTIPDKVIKKTDYKNVCLNCPNHRDD